MLLNRGFSDIVVSGIGIVSPLANGREATWSRLLDGQTAIHKTTRGLEARVFDFSPNGARSRMGDFALLAAGEALAHAGISECLINSRTIGCAVSQSKPILSDSIDPTLLMSSFFGWSPESLIQRDFGLEGPTANVAAACATGVVSLLTAARWLETGECDFVLAGAAESSLGDFYSSGFKRMGVLAEGIDARAVRPFDQDRSGFAMGEGAAVLVLEKEDSAQARNHTPLARLKNIHMVHNASDVIAFDESGKTVADLLKKTSDRTDYINAHGTGTLLNDLAEGRGIASAFHDSYPLVSSTKAATGHLLGAAGALEAAFCVLALRDQVAPATLHLENPDSRMQLNHVRKSKSTKLQTSLSLSYGFGGQMGAVLFERMA